MLRIRRTFTYATRDATLIPGICEVLPAPNDRFGSRPAARRCPRCIWVTIASIDCVLLPPDIESSARANDSSLLLERRLANLVARGEGGGPGGERAMRPRRVLGDVVADPRKNRPPELVLVLLVVQPLLLLGVGDERGLDHDLRHVRHLQQ